MHRYASLSCRIANPKKSSQRPHKTSLQPAPQLKPVCLHTATRRAAESGFLWDQQLVTRPKPDEADQHPQTVGRPAYLPHTLSAQAECKSHRGNHTQKPWQNHLRASQSITAFCRESHHMPSRKRHKRRPRHQRQRNWVLSTSSGKWCKQRVKRGNMPRRGSHGDRSDQLGLEEIQEGLLKVRQEQWGRRSQTRKV